MSVGPLPHCRASTEARAWVTSLLFSEPINTVLVAASLLSAAPDITTRNFSERDKEVKKYEEHMYTK